MSYTWKLGRNDCGNLQNMFRYRVSLETELKPPTLDLNLSTSLKIFFPPELLCWIADVETRIVEKVSMDNTDQFHFQPNLDLDEEF